MLRREMMALIGVATLIARYGGAMQPTLKIVATENEILILEDGRKIWLLGILALQLSADEEQEDAGNAEMSAAMAADAIGRSAELSAFMGPDRSGRYGAIVTLAGDEVSLNERLIRGGLGRVYLLPNLPKATDPGATLLPALLKAEAAARAEGRGFWRYPTYRPRQAGAESLWNARHQFHLIEGRVKQVGPRAGGGAELTLGEGRKALKVLLTSSIVRELHEKGLDPYTLANQKLRVRGWIDFAGHLSISLERPEYLEKLS